MRAEDSQTPSHPIPLDGQAPLEGGAARADTLAGGVLLLLALTVMQRGVGFVREIFFCRWLDPEQLGLWDMGFAFLMLAAPLLVLSLPGAFGRYVDHYRSSGQLRVFLCRTAWFCAALALPAAAGIWLARSWIASLIFASADRTDLVCLLVPSLLVIIVFNYLVCLLTALRNMRWAAGMQLANSVLFAVLGLGLALAWQPSAAGMIIAYGLASLVCAVAGLVWLARAWRSFPQIAAPLPRRTLWSRLLPFAVWLMVINFLWNLFDVVDRYMIVHYSSASSAESLVAVGNYRSSRVMPLLLASVTAMIATVILPHLSHDWEAGRRERVSARLNLLLKLGAVLLTAAATAILLFAPLLFQVVFHGKYAGGLSVLPWTLTYCAWFGLTMLAQTYLWCTERAGLAGLAAIVGVTLNVALNCLLLPRLGLGGAVLATAAANLTALVLIVAMSQRLGFRLQRSTAVVLALPICVCLGPAVATLALLAILLEIVGSDRFLSGEEKHELATGAAEYLDRIPWLRDRIGRWKTAMYSSRSA